MTGLRGAGPGGLRAVTVCVDYTDCLRLTLPYNRHHFDRVLVVTSPSNEAEVRFEAVRVGAEVLVTDVFYARGAEFNKWAAIEEGLDVLGRVGWMCVMDADVLWPNEVPRNWVPGFLYTPLRRMFPTVPAAPPDEREWIRYPHHKNLGEWAGYTQIFHANDPALWTGPEDTLAAHGITRWYETNWTHAGGADTFFQAKWSPDKKVRPPFEVLHLGEAGTNWCGRASRYADGSEPPEARRRLVELRKFMAGRRRARTGDPYSDEKLK